MKAERPIGVFDSGVGGLTVYKALRHRLPSEDFVYLGDTANLPYGAKSPETVIRYATQATERLLRENIKMLVVACNTATALALRSLRKAFPELPCLGVVSPGARLAAEATRNGKIVVLATEGTVRSKAYQEAILRLKPKAQVEGVACNVLVSLADEGWIDGPIVQDAIARYLSQIQIEGYDTLVLGCTHFPLLAPEIKKQISEQVVLIDSAETTAKAVALYLEDHSLSARSGRTGRDSFLVTDRPGRFATVAERFLGRSVAGKVDLTMTYGELVGLANPRDLCYPFDLEDSQDMPIRAEA